MSEMQERPHYEHTEETEEEKRGEKQEKEEKSWDEKWRRDPLSAVVWAVILIWAGLSFLAETMGLLGNLREVWGLPELGPWNLIFTGAGLLVLLEAVIRLTIPEYRRPVGGTLILGAIFLGIGLGGLLGWGVAWPLILIAVGVGLLLRGMLGRQ